MSRAYKKPDGTWGYDVTPSETAYQMGQYSYNDIANAKERNEVAARTEMIQQAMRNPERFDTSVRFEQMRDLLALRGNNESRALDQRIDWAIYQLEKEKGWSIPTEDHYYEEDDAIYRVPTDWAMFSENVASALHDEEAMATHVELETAKLEAQEVSAMRETEGADDAFYVDEEY